MEGDIRVLLWGVIGLVRNGYFLNYLSVAEASPISVD